MNFKNCVVIVTGASSGIGCATARLFAEKGARVVLASRNKEKLKILSQQLPNSIAIPTDMTQEKDIKRMVEQTYEHFGQIDVLINNAGQGYDSLVELINRDTFNDIIALDLLGPISAMQQVIPIMRKQHKGSIINISSGTALMVLPTMSPYASIKQALAKVSLTAREELQKDGINISVVYPYITNTNFEKNTHIEKGLPVWESSGRELPSADRPEFVAQKILEAVAVHPAELFAHEWMKR